MHSRLFPTTAHVFFLQLDFAVRNGRQNVFKVRAENTQVLSCIFYYFPCYIKMHELHFLFLDSFRLVLVSS